jgi:hypothetical protein
MTNKYVTVIASQSTKVKAGNIEAVAVNAETIALNARHIPLLFPKRSASDKSNAKPEIWEKWDEFESRAKNLEAEAVKLRDAARGKDAATTEAMVKDFFRLNCGTAHPVPEATDVRPIRLDGRDPRRVAAKAPRGLRRPLIGPSPVLAESR